jgi:hypothetical protein
MMSEYNEFLDSIAASMNDIEKSMDYWVRRDQRENEQVEMNFIIKEGLHELADALYNGLGDIAEALKDSTIRVVKK